VLRKAAENAAAAASAADADADVDVDAADGSSDDSSELISAAQSSKQSSSKRRAVAAAPTSSSDSSPQQQAPLKSSKKSVNRLRKSREVISSNEGSDTGLSAAPSRLDRVANRAKVAAAQELAENEAEQLAEQQALALAAAAHNDGGVSAVGGADADADAVQQNLEREAMAAAVADMGAACASGAV